MKTEIRPATENLSLEWALELLRSGNVVALPTDTVYGVAVDGLNPEAIEKLFAVKDRPGDKAIPLLLADLADLDRVAASLPVASRILAARFWPGGLTLVVPARKVVPEVLRAGGETVAVRVPDHSVPRHLARMLGRPLAATSANISGGTNPMSAEQVLEQLAGRILLILDGGTVGKGVPSTVVDVSVSPRRIVRAGAISSEEIEAVLREGG
jgi:L-threonylcarbamoyladenylate synthase